MQASGIRKRQHIVLQQRSGGSGAHCFVCFVAGGAKRGVASARAGATRYVGGCNVLVVLCSPKYLSDKRTWRERGGEGGGTFDPHPLK